MNAEVHNDYFAKLSKDFGVADLSVKYIIRIGEKKRRGRNDQLKQFSLVVPCSP